MHFQNYQTVSGKDADTLWRLSENFNYAPQWTSYFISGIGDHESDTDRPPSLTVAKRKNTKRTETLRICNVASRNSSDSMPPLQSSSEISADGDDDDDSLSEEEKDDGDLTDEYAYDTEEEDNIRELLREAMDVAHQVDWLSGTDMPKEMVLFEQEDRKGNPFLKLLGSLKGQTIYLFLIFSS